MSSYCLCLSLDGHKKAPVSANSDSAPDAIEHGREKLLEGVHLVKPALAYCVIYVSDEIDAVPVGVWDWSREAPHPVWTPQE